MLAGQIGVARDCARRREVEVALEGEAPEGQGGGELVQAHFDGGNLVTTFCRFLYEWRSHQVPNHDSPDGSDTEYLEEHLKSKRGCKVRACLVRDEAV
jgi:hypothetical protein